MPRILIVDDDPDLANSMKVVLESKGYDVSLASNGEEGLEKAKSEKPDVMVLDVMMESISTGFNVCRELKKDEKYKDIAIIVLTAIKQETGLDFNKEAGDEEWLPADDYCEKPLDSNDLITKVENLLKKTKDAA